MPSATTPPAYPLNVCPPKWRQHAHHFTVGVAADRMMVWNWLNRPETFTKDQPPFFHVEFVSPDPDKIPANFSEGVFTVHHGPFLNFAGILTRIEPGQYRDLQYFYGSYAISQRLIRPARLQFWVEEMIPGVICVHGQVDSYVHPWMHRLWTWVQERFWGQFGRLMQRSLENRPQPSTNLLPSPKTEEQPLEQESLQTHDQELAIAARADADMTPPHGDMIRSETAA